MEVHFTIVLDELQLTWLFNYVCIQELCVAGVAMLLPENIPKHARHSGKFTAYCFKVLKDI